MASTFPNAVKIGHDIASSEGHAPVSKHICGWDNGKGKKRVDRNAACSCGSGHKAKHCCLAEERKKTHGVRIYTTNCERIVQLRLEQERKDRQR